MKTDRHSAGRREQVPAPTFALSIDTDPLVEVVGRHVALSPQDMLRIRRDLAKLFQSPRVNGRGHGHGMAAPVKALAATDAVISTQQAADLVGVSRPYIVARIEAGDIALHQQVGNQRRVLKSAVLAWHRREQASRRRALGQLGADLEA